MKHMIKLPAIVLGLMLLLTGTTQKVMAQDEDISLQSFYDELSPYGTWIQDPQYGYVWRPDADQGDFRPYYTNGRWAMTEYGNTWVSNYDWGWAPFHYGRWVYNRYNQWVWIPDTVWGPAWVSWRSGGGYYGWAPMGPGMNVNVNFSIPDLWWVFVPQRNIYYNSFPRYYSRRNITIIHNTTVINHVYSRNRRNYYTGPRVDDIRRDTRQAVQVYNVNRVSRPSRGGITGNKVDIYAPPRSSRGNSNAIAAPKNVVRGEGYATARPERGNTGSTVRNQADRSSRGEQGMNNGTVRDNGNIGSRPDRGQATNTSRETRGERPQPTQPVAPRVDRSSEQQNNGRPQRQVQPEVRQMQPETRQVQPQRQEAPRQEAPRQMPQPQRQESRPEPRPQPQPQRVEQSRPSRSSGSESRGNQGGSRENSSSRPTRSGRG